jgi:hypothetical protein
MMILEAFVADDAGCDGRDTVRDEPGLVRRIPQRAFGCTIAAEASRSDDV